jgi:hypothetical protein
MSASPHLVNQLQLGAFLLQLALQALYPQLQLLLISLPCLKFMQSIAFWKDKGLLPKNKEKARLCQHFIESC